MNDFKPMLGFEGVIEISGNGEIKSLARNGTPEKILKSSIGTKGYLKVSFRVLGKQYTKNVHRLLAENFIENPDNLPCVNHIDGNKLNNSIENLEWCSYSHNVKHAYDNGLSTPYLGSKGTGLTNNDVLRIVELKSKGRTLEKIASDFDVSASCISDIVLGRTWSHLTGITFIGHERGSRKRNSKNQTSRCSTKKRF